MFLCIPIPGPGLDSVRSQMTQALKLGTMIEWRLDLFEEIATEELLFLRRHYPLPIVATLKKHRTHFYLRHLQQLQPEIVDVELGIRREEMAEIKKELPHAHVMLSYHDHLHMPEDLNSLLHDMQQLSADYYKIAVTPHNAVEALKLVNFVREVNRVGGTLVGVGMDADGEIARLLAPIMGVPLTYACLDESCQTAPGQLSVDTMRNIYRVQDLSFDSQILGLIGDPVSKRRGYLVHNDVFEQLSLPAVYVRMRINGHELGAFLQEARALKWKGFSVTMPLKETVIPYLDKVDPAAKAIGAVNTIVWEDEQYVGYNFDGIGALEAIEAKRRVKGKLFIVVGAGGAAKAIAYEAKQRGATVVVVNRTYDRAKALADKLSVTVQPFQELQKLLQEADFLAQTTSVGMGHGNEETLITPQDLSKETLVFDAIAIPTETRLIRDAMFRGCEVVTGDKMWLEQARRQFSAWFPGVFSERKILDAYELANSRQP